MYCGDPAGPSDRRGHGGQPGEVRHVGCGVTVTGCMLLADGIISSAEETGCAQVHRAGVLGYRPEGDLGK